MLYQPLMRGRAPAVCCGASYGTGETPTGVYTYWPGWCRVCLFDAGTGRFNATS